LIPLKPCFVSVLIVIIGVYSEPILEQGPSQNNPKRVEDFGEEFAR